MVCQPIVLVHMISGTLPLLVARHGSTVAISVGFGGVLRSPSPPIRRDCFVARAPRKDRGVSTPDYWLLTPDCRLFSHVVQSFKAAWVVDGRGAGLKPCATCSSFCWQWHHVGVTYLSEPDHRLGDFVSPPLPTTLLWRSESCTFAMGLHPLKFPCREREVRFWKTLCIGKPKVEMKDGINKVYGWIIENRGKIEEHVGFQIW